MCFGLPQVIEHTKYQSRTEFDSAVDKVLEEFSVELICLAGFMRILSGPFVKKWEGEHSWGGVHGHKGISEVVTRKKRDGTR